MGCVGLVCTCGEAAERGLLEGTVHVGVDYSNAASSCSHRS